MLLYVLLAGRHPTGEGCRTAAEHLRGVLDTEPPRLSAVATAAEDRGSSVDRLRRLYAGDLDSIVAMALEKRPDHRYATVGDFAEDIRRYLRHEPVTARPDSFRYRAGKFVRRNRVAVGAAAAVSLVLLASTIFSLGQLREARRQRDAALEEAHRRTAMADVQGLLAGDTRGAGGRPLSMLERIELAERLLTRAHEREPAVVVEVLADLSARLYQDGEREAQRRLLERAGSIARQAGLPAHLVLTDCLRALTLTFDDQLDSARTLLAATRRIREHNAATPPWIEAECLNAEGQLLVAEDSAGAAIALLEGALPLADSNSLQSRQVRNSLATALRAAGPNAGGYTRAAADPGRAGSRGLSGA